MDLRDGVVKGRVCGYGEEDSEGEEDHYNGPTGFAVPPPLEGEANLY